MGRRKQIIIFVSLLVLQAACVCCAEENLFISGSTPDLSDKLERLQIYFETEMHEEALALLDELVAQFPNDPKFKYLQAIINFQRGDYDRAERVFTEFVKEFPQVAEPYYLLGQIYLNKEDIEKARDYFTRYCELVPEDYDAYCKLNSLSLDDSAKAVIMKDGEEDLHLVKNVGFYGACIHMQQNQMIKLVNGSFCNWSSMGIDFTYPLDLRRKQIILKLKGKQGGEKLALTFRDKFAQDYNPQLVLIPEEKNISRNWQNIKIVFGDDCSGIDLSSVVHMGLEFGFSTVQNPANSTLFVKDIIIK